MNLVFEGKNNNNYIELYIDDDNIVWIERYYIDKSSDECIKEFCKKLCEKFDETKTKKNALFHRQYILKEEFHQFDFLQNDERWEVVGDDNDCLLIECDIDDAPKCIIEAFIGDFLYTEN
jgi:hypothetical protein